MADKSKFNDMTQVVIDKLEGGYYNPQWHSTGDSRYSTSGETMFGIDRKRGGSINDTTAGREFWGIIDKNKTPEVWKWNYKGGGLAPTLKPLVSDMLYPQYESLSTKYLSQKAKQIVDNDNRLLFNFIYATWNGAGWFKKFATDMNKAVDSGVTNTDELVKVAIKSRTEEGLETGSQPNSLIAQGGNKIAKFIDSLGGYISSGTKEAYKKVKQNPITTALITVVVIVAGYSLYKVLIKK